jgi:hypothetical protein
MGVVYRARHLALKRVVAVKTILGGDAAGEHERARFKAEAEAVARLQHPNIVQIFEVGEAEGRPYFSLEFVEGGSLSARLRGNPVPAGEAARLLEALAGAAQYAHERGVIHRDLKPANVLLTQQGQPKISDFGLAKQLDAGPGETRTGAVLGTPSYMAPEQAAGKVKELGPRTDVYALGAILYELLTGRPPFRAASALDTLEQVRTQDPVPVRRLQPKAPRDLETVCLKCLEKDPARRYATAGELADDLRRFLAGEPVRARRLGPAGRAWRWCRRHPVAAAAGLTAVLVLLSALAYWQTRPAYLDVRVAPRAASVLFDGQPVPLEDGQALVACGPGRHHLAFRSPGYQEQEEQVVLVRGRDNAAVVSVELTSLRGRLHQETDPPGAAVEVVDQAGRVRAGGTTPFFSPELTSGRYTVRLRKELYRPAEVPRTVPRGGRVADGEVVKLEVDPKASESAHLLDLMRKVAEPKDFPATRAGMPLRDFLAEVSERYRCAILLGGPLARPKSSPALRQAMPPLRISADRLLRARLGSLQLTYVPVVSKGADGFALEVTTLEEAEQRTYRLLHPVGDLVGGPGGWGPAKLVNAIRQSVANPSTWAPFPQGDRPPASLGYHEDLQALQVSAAWSVQQEVNDYLAELRLTWRTGSKSLPPRPGRITPVPGGLPQPDGPVGLPFGGGLGLGGLPLPPAGFRPPPVVALARVSEEGGRLRLHLRQPNPFAALPAGRPPEAGTKPDRPAPAGGSRWLESVQPLDDPALRIVDVRGQAVSPEVVRQRLRKETAVLFGVGAAPDPFALQTTRPDTLVILVAAQQPWLAPVVPRP